MPKDKKRIRFKNLPHFITCKRCDLEIPCPKKAENEEANAENEEAIEIYIDEKTVESQTDSYFDGFLKTCGALSITEKCTLVTEIFKSEKDSIYEDYVKATLPPDSTVTTIAEMDPHSWYNQRHPLLKTLADILSQVILWSFVCDLCGAKVFREEEWKRHVKQTHPNTSHTPRSQEFGNILLLPGGGHMFMQMLKSLRSLTFDIWGEEVAKRLGCRTPKAKMWAKNCSDTHQAWETTEAEKGALASEIFTQYVKHCLNELKLDKKDISLEHFLNNYISGACESSANLKFAYSVLSEFYVAITVFDIGIHRNHPDYIQSGLNHFRPMWHIRNHPIYRPLMEIFENMKVCLAEISSGGGAGKDLMEFVISTQSLIVSGDKTTGHAPDFVMEESNAVAQSQLPPGLPSNQTWLRIYRHYEGLKKIRESWFENCGIADPKNRVLTRLRCDGNLEHEVRELQMIFREVGYFDNGSSHTDVNGKVLNSNLKDILSLGEKSRILNLQRVVNTRSFLELSKSDLEVFVTDDEESRRKTKTQKAMNLEIESIIEGIPDFDMKEKWRQLWLPWKEINTKEASWKFLIKIKSDDI